MFKQDLKVLTLATMLLLSLVVRKSWAVVNPVYTEYFANYRNHPDDDKVCMYRYIKIPLNAKTI